jgi:hypothetical protein
MSKAANALSRRDTRCATSVHGTFETCRLRRAMSEFEGKAKNICFALSSSQFDPNRTWLQSLCVSRSNVFIIATTARRGEALSVDQDKEQDWDERDDVSRRQPIQEGGQLHDKHLPQPIAGSRRRIEGPRESTLVAAWLN